MPAPAVIPAPIAYINAAAVKGFVVEYGVVSLAVNPAPLHPSVIDGTVAFRILALTCGVKVFAEEVDNTHVTHAWPPVVITVKKTACSRQPLAVV